MKQKNNPQELAAKYVKIVEWSDEDGCYIGSAPPLVGQSCHGDTESAVLKQLQDIVEDVIAMKLKYKAALPAASAGRDFSGKFVLRTGEDLHRLLAIRALQAGDSLNNFVVKALKKVA